MKVYNVILDWKYEDDHDCEVMSFDTLEQAQEMFSKLKNEEINQSWISGADFDDLLEYEDEDTMFVCVDYDKYTRIYLEERSM